MCCNVMIKFILSEINNFHILYCLFITTFYNIKSKIFIIQIRIDLKREMGHS